MPGLSPFVRRLSAAGSQGDRQKIDVTGSTVFMRQVSVGTVRVTTEALRSADKHTVDMSQADKLFTVEEYGSVYIQNFQSTAIDIEMYLGIGDFNQPVPDIVNVSLSAASANLSPSDDAVNIDADNAGAELLSAANPERLRIMITALSTNANAIRVGDSTVDSDRGIPLQAGESVALLTQAAIYACSEAAADQGAAILEETV